MEKVTPQNIIPEVEALKGESGKGVSKTAFDALETRVSTVETDKATKVEVAKKATKDALSALEARVAALESV